MPKSVATETLTCVEKIRPRSIDEIHHKSIGRSQASSILPMLAWMAGGFASYGLRGRGRKPYDPLEGIDIQAEAELVRQKKSGLSYSLRQEVLRRDAANNTDSR